MISSLVYQNMHYLLFSMLYLFKFNSCNLSAFKIYGKWSDLYDLKDIPKYHLSYPQKPWDIS